MLAGGRANPKLPSAVVHVPVWAQEIAALDDFLKRCQGDDPILRYLRQTAASYAEAGRMLMAAGTPEFTQRSIHLYGRPDDVYATQSFTGVDAASFLLEKTESMYRCPHNVSTHPDVSAVPFAKRLGQAIQTYFEEDRVKVVVDDKLSSKAIAGTTRLRVRASAVFSDLDFDQLYHHEALVHMARAINGRRQSMAGGNPISSVSVSGRPAPHARKRGLRFSQNLRHGRLISTACAAWGCGSWHSRWPWTELISSNVSSFS